VNVLVIQLKPYLLILYFRFNGMKKIPYYPSRWEIVKFISKLYVPMKGERIVDLGSGDARVLTTLGKTYDDIELIGVEKNVKLVSASLKRIKRLGLDNIRIIKGDLFKFPLSRNKVDTIYAYLTKDALSKLKPKFLNFLNEDGLIILLDFRIPELKPATVIPINSSGGKHYLFIYGSERRLRQFKL